MTAAYASAAAAAVANLGSTSVAPAKPTGVASGDLLIAVCWSGAGAVCTWTAPAGWSAADASNSANGVGVYVFHRVADGTEGSSFTFTRGSTSNNAGAMIVRVTGADTTTPVAAAAVTGSSATTVVLPTVTASGANTELLQLGLPISAGSFTWTPPAGATQEAIITATGTALQAMVGDETVGSGATGTRTWTHTTSTTMRGAMIAINPAAGSGVTGTMASTLADATMAAAGGETIAGPLATTLADAGLLIDPLRTFWDAIIGRATGRVDVGMIAASVTEGYPDTWDKTQEQRLAGKLRTRYGVASSGAGFIGVPSVPVQGIGTSPVSWVGGTYDSSFGWGANHGIWYTTPAQNGILKLTLPSAATQVLIDTFIGPLGNATGGRYRVNGGSWVTFNTLAGATAAASVTINASLAAGDTLEVGYNTGTGNVLCTGFRVSSGDETSGIQVHNYGHSSFTIANWQAGTGGAPQWSAEIVRHNLDLLILGEFGGNDGNAAGGSPLTAAAFQTAYGNFIDTIRTAGYAGPIALMLYPDASAGITFLEPWQRYEAAIRAVAAAKDCLLIDLPAAGIPAPPSGTLYGADNVHGATNGTLYDLIAGAIDTAIAEPPTGILAATLGDATLAGTGTVTNSITGALAATLDDAAMTASGNETIAGTMATALDDVALAGAGTETITGTAATALADSTLAATGNETIAGALAASLDEATLAAAGVVANPVTGTMSAALADATLAALGTVGDDPTIFGILAATLTDATLAAAGNETIPGNLAATLDDATLAAAGNETVAGVIVATLEGALLSAVAQQSFIGTLTATLDDAALLATGTASATAARDVTVVGLAQRTRTVTVIERDHGGTIVERARPVAIIERE